MRSGKVCVADAQILEIYQRHRRGLFALALSITGCPMRAEDAVHDAFARLCRMNLASATNADAYAFIAVRNAALDLTYPVARYGGTDCAVPARANAEDWSTHAAYLSFDTMPRFQPTRRLIR